MIERRNAEMRAWTMVIANGTAIGSPLGGGQKAYDAWLAAQNAPTRRTAGDPAAGWAALKATAAQLKGEMRQMGDAVRFNEARKEYTRPTSDPAFAATTLEEFIAATKGRTPPGKVN